ncbi:MAG: PQQ-dependent sugar dehydrogenase [Candidatus Thermoplasmatota archaeon]|nr:PQQ-dependent sugar dehydrogenase [Candidatus Thermoplasmatota archaeon]
MGTAKHSSHGEFRKSLSFSSILLIIVLLLTSSIPLKLEGSNRSPLSNPDAVAKVKWPTITTLNVTGNLHLEKVTDAVTLPDDLGWLVTLQNGTVSHQTMESGYAVEQGSFIIPNIHYTSDCGLLSITLDPNWSVNGLTYFGKCDSVTHNSIIIVQIDVGTPNYILEGPTTVLTVGSDEATQNWHNVGSIGFDNDGYMWALFGDKDLDDVASDSTNPLGSLLLFSPIKNATTSGVQPISSIDNEQNHLVHAWGLRSPWTGTLDPWGRWWIVDVGSSVEELNIVEGNQFLGWDEIEGPCSMRCSTSSDPYTWWDRDSTNPLTLEDPEANPFGCQVGWMGPIIKGPELSSGEHDYFAIFGEFCKGWIRAVHINSDGVVGPHNHIGHMDEVAAWIEHGGNWLVFSHGGYLSSDSKSSIQVVSFEWEYSNEGQS